MSKGRRGTVFAEAYNPEEDDEDDVKVNPLMLILLRNPKEKIINLLVLNFYEYMI